MPVLASRDKPVNNTRLSRPLASSRWRRWYCSPGLTATRLGWHHRRRSSRSREV